MFQSWLGLFTDVLQSHLTSPFLRLDESLIVSLIVEITVNSHLVIVSKINNKHVSIFSRKTFCNQHKCKCFHEKAKMFSTLLLILWYAVKKLMIIVFKMTSTA